MRAKFLLSVSIEVRRIAQGEVCNERHGETRSQVQVVLRRKPSLMISGSERPERAS